jgi:hypothetical protein
MSVRMVPALRARGLAAGGKLGAGKNEPDQGR